VDGAAVDAYLARIGAGRPSGVDVAGLRDLHERHLATVPFENLDVIRGVPIELTDDALLTKVVADRRGGYCYELNGAFALLLRALGFPVTMLAAAVHGPNGLGPPFDHLVLRVDLPEPWLVDVGFGRHSLHPLRQAERRDQADPAGTFRVTEVERGDIEVLRDGAPKYRVEARARELTDFAPANWWQQSWPGSHFRTGPVTTLSTARGQLTLAGRTLIHTEDGVRTETVLATDADVLAAYDEHFGIRLDRLP
jgi:N-hydroxyarylamine O-acetyltransferase